MIKANNSELPIESSLDTTTNNEMKDDFSTYLDQTIITDYSSYSSVTFPFGGTSLPHNPSTIWESGTGKFEADRGWGYSGKPNEWHNRWFFRINTRRFSFGNVTINWSYKSAPFGEDGYSVEVPDAVSLWLRYQTEYNLYVIQFDRTNNVVCAKRKVPAEGWSGPTNLIANKGVYYALFTDEEQPVVGANVQSIAWSSLHLPNLAHDSMTEYHFKATVTNKPDGTVQLQLWRDDCLVASWLDNSNGTTVNGESLSTHLQLGYYDNVPGWNSSWGLPITNEGAVGFRADNIKVWIQDVIVSSTRAD